MLAIKIFIILVFLQIFVNSAFKILIIVFVQFLQCLPPVFHQNPKNGRVDD